MDFSSKLPNVGTSIFTVMSGLAREHNAINLSQGFPDFNCDQKLLELTQKYTNEGFNQYAPMQGALVLREQIALLMQNCYGATYHPETEITITAGATQGIYTAISAFIKKGDEVIIFGNDLKIMELAIKINTIAYEILTSVSERVKRVFYQL